MCVCVCIDLVWFCCFVLFMEGFLLLLLGLGGGGCFFWGGGCVLGVCFFVFWGGFFF